MPKKKPLHLREGVKGRTLTQSFFFHAMLGIKPIPKFIISVRRRGPNRN
jgi:hypothetical protein